MVLMPERLNVDQKAPSESTLRRIRVLGLVFAVSVACGNIALVYVFPSFTQVVASSTPIATASAAFLIQGRIETTKALLCIGGMCMGCALAAWGEVNFHVIGFSAICLATALRGLKSVLGSILLTGEDSLDALSLLYYTSQTAAGILTIAVIAVEAVPMWTDPLVLYAAAGMWPMIGVSCVIAFCMNLCNLLVTFYTSATTVSVLGNVKSCLVIIVSVSIFGNTISALAGVGTFVTLFSAAIYSQTRWIESGARTKTRISDVDVENV